MNEPVPHKRSQEALHSEQQTPHLPGVEGLDRFSHILEYLCRPMAGTGAPVVTREIISPDGAWSARLETDRISDWSCLKLTSSSDGTTFQAPPLRTSAAVWFADSSALLFAAFPSGRPGEVSPSGPERLFLFSAETRRFEELPLSYPDDARLSVMTDAGRRALISVREGNNSQRSLLELDLEQSACIHARPVPASPGFYPVQPWKEGYMGISDGARGHGQVEFVQAQSTPRILHTERDQIVRHAVIDQDTLTVVTARAGETKIIEQSLNETSEERTIYQGDLVVHSLSHSSHNGISATVSRLDFAPITIGCTQEGFAAVVRALPSHALSHQHIEIPLHSQYQIPLEFYRPAEERTDRLLVCVYGAWGEALDQRFNALRSAWIESGGSLLLVGVRGGGENGAQWHAAGRGGAKGAAIMDLVHTLTFIKDHPLFAGYKMVAHGYSAGATVLAAAAALAPELVSRAVLEAGVYDMQHFPDYSMGSGWKEEFGDPKTDPEPFAAFSPLTAFSSPHPGRFLITSGSLDGTVAPSHSRLLAGKLRALGAGELIEIPGAGHYIETPLSFSSTDPLRQRVLSILSKEIHFLRSVDS